MISALALRALGACDNLGWFSIIRLGYLMAIGAIVV